MVRLRSATVRQWLFYRLSSVMAERELNSGNKLVRVVSPHFVAGVVVDRRDIRCIRAALILEWTIDRHQDEPRRYFARKGYRATVVRDFAA